MITQANYYQQSPGFKWDEMPEALRETREFLDMITDNGQDWSSVDADTDVQKMVAVYFDKLNEYLQKQQPAVKEKKTAREKSIKQPSEKTVEPEPVKSEDVPYEPSPTEHKKTSRQRKPKTATAIVEELDKILVETLPEEIRIFKRMVNMNGKIVERKAVLNLLNYLQKAILERRIRKDSVYAVDIMSIQKDLINRLPKIKDRAEIRLTVKMEEYFRGEIDKYETYKGVALLKRYVSMHGKPVSKEKADRLLKDMQYAVAKGKIMGTDRYYFPIQAAMQRLEKLSNEGMLKIEPYELNGIGALVFCEDTDAPAELDGCGCPQPAVQPMPEPDGIFKMSDVMNREYEKVELDGKWKEFLGRPVVGFSMAITGPAGDGKSTFAVAFANYLHRKFGGVLYVSYEMDGAELQEIGRRIGETLEMYGTKKLPEDLSPFRFIFIDSVSESGIDWQQWKQIMENNPGKAFIFLAKARKDGTYKGSADIVSDTKLHIIVEDGVAYTDKNRFALETSMPVPGYKNPKLNTKSNGNQEWK